MIGRQATDYWIARASFRCAPDPNDKAITAALAELLATAGVVQAEKIGDELVVAYDFREISHQKIGATLSCANVLMPLSFWERFRHSVVQYREQIKRSEQSMEYGWDGWIREVYVSRYKHRDHGRRDDRVKHWRQYMNDESVD